MLTKRDETPWLVESSVYGTVPHDYEPNIRLSMIPEEYQLSARIGKFPLTDDELQRVPKFLVVGRNSRGEVPAIQGWSVGPFIVNQHVRDILEELEPGVQQFHPITVKAKDGKPIKGQTALPYYILMCPPLLDCVDIDRTTWGDFGTGVAAFARYGRLGTADDATITLRGSIIRGHHFWRWKAPSGYNFFASDELRQKLKEQRLRGWHFAKKCDVF